MTFKGLSGSLNAGAVCNAIPHISRLTDFEKDQPAIETLLQTMQDIARVVKADALGLVGEAHFRRRFEQWYGVKRFWYQKVATEIDDIPYVFEAALAETHKPGRFFHGLNFSPSFEDPFPDTRLAWEDIVAYGAGSFSSAPTPIPTRRLVPHGGGHPPDDPEPGRTGQGEDARQGPRGAGGEDSPRLLAREQGPLQGRRAAAERRRQARPGRPPAGGAERTQPAANGVHGGRDACRPETRHRREIPCLDPHPVLLGAPGIPEIHGSDPGEPVFRA